MFLLNFYFHQPLFQRSHLDILFLPPSLLVLLVLFVVFVVVVLLLLINFGFTFNID